MVQPAVDRKLSEAVALKFQKTRTLYLGYVQKNLFFTFMGVDNHIYKIANETT